MFNKLSQSQRGKYCMFSFLCGSQILHRHIRLHGVKVGSKLSRGTKEGEGEDGGVSREYTCTLV